MIKCEEIDGRYDVQIKGAMYNEILPELTAIITTTCEGLAEYGGYDRERVEDTLVQVLRGGLDAYYEKSSAGEPDEA